MDNKPAGTTRQHFLVTGTATPQRLIWQGDRNAVVFVNESSSFPIRIGHSGTVASRGLLIGAGLSFADNYTTDDWWVVGSGTNVSGFVAL